MRSAHLLLWTGTVMTVALVHAIVDLEMSGNVFFNPIPNGLFQFPVPVPPTPIPILLVVSRQITSDQYSTMHGTVLL